MEITLKIDYIITNVSVSVGADSISTTYSFRSYTTRFGKFARHNANALQAMAKQTENIMSSVRAQLSFIQGKNIFCKLRPMLPLRLQPPASYNRLQSS